MFIFARLTGSVTLHSFRLRQTKVQLWELQKGVVVVMRCAPKPHPSERGMFRLPRPMETRLCGSAVDPRCLQAHKAIFKAKFMVFVFRPALPLV